jgi:hypothetical protein
MIPLLLLFLVCLSSAKVTIFVNDEPVHTVLSHDWFQRKTSPFNVTGLPIRVRYDTIDKRKKLCKAYYEPVHPEGADLSQFDQSVLIIDMNEAYYCERKSYSDAFYAARNYPKYLAEMNLPPAKTVVFLTWNKWKSGLRVGPFFEPYVHRRPTRSSKQPPKELNVALVDMGDADGVESALLESNGNKTISIVVEQEPGTWNRWFTAWWFYAFTYTLFVVDMAMVVLAIAALVKSVKDKEPIVTVRNAIIVLAMLSTLFYAICMLLPIRSFAPTMLAAFGGFFVHLAFFLLLYLWSMFLAQVETSPYIKWFQIVTFICVGIATLEFAMDMVFASLRKGPGLDLADQIINMIYTISRLFVATLFLGVAGYFEYKRRGVASDKNEAALRRLTIIGGLTFFCFLILGGVQLGLLVYKTRTPNSYMAVYMIRTVTGVMRSAVLLLLLGVKSKPDSTKKQPKHLEGGRWKKTSAADTIVPKDEPTKKKLLAK